MPGVSGDFLFTVSELARARVLKMGTFLDGDWDIRSLVGGKMIRSRFAARVTRGDFGSLKTKNAAKLCAAAEIVHTASLCHDDVIDNAPIRRAQPALWRLISPSGAVLIGDLLLCEAIDLLLEVEDGRYLRDFVSKLREVCATETEQELLLRGRRLDEEKCLEIGRGKTGPLFAFLGLISSADDPALARALEEAGYRVGTAYQLADDLLDCVGDADRAGKTLGTDCSRRKFTLAQKSECGADQLRDHISGLSRSAVKILSPWPDAMAGLEQFLESDLQPVWANQLGDIDLSLRCAT